MSLAVLYINSHHRNGFFVREANESAKSFRKYLPDAKYYLYTDAKDLDGIDQFDEIRDAEFYVPEFLKNRCHMNGQMIVKHRVMQEMSEDKVLLLGADTYALKDGVAVLPDLLDNFDIAASHAPKTRIVPSHTHGLIPELPVAFPEFNCDLILYNNTQAVKNFIKSWANAYLADMFSHYHDQGTFRFLLYKTNLRIATLPPEWNYRLDLYREDTVILQNREKLHEYLQSQKQPTN
ncbi:hypothetical protein [Paraglaciecola sp. MB-3u-78]|uniref:hypothetical protein n=1 Tax=Paraglaciecola sp. MB-3u-78 TaxID=2058332 RepID=UPI000C32DBA8|nr:hypothetical protein [Paraglaciecola sp. MB-3u-78]PKG95626.1 hypothetical protein CXF95_25825 [Paraglaciecola sp. MB-3u-78]